MEGRGPIENYSNFMRATVTTLFEAGGTYSNQYVFIFQFAHDKIILRKEYFNPLRLPNLSS